MGVGEVPLLNALLEESLEVGELQEKMGGRDRVASEPEQAPHMMIIKQLFDARQLGILSGPRRLHPPALFSRHPLQDCIGGERMIHER